MPNRDKWTADDIPDLTSKLVVVTGGNSGIGSGRSRQSRARTPRRWWRAARPSEGRPPATH